MFRVGSQVLDGDGGSEHRRQLLPSYKAHRRKFSRKSSAPKKYPAERSHVVMDVLTKCNVPVGEPWLTVSSILYLKLPTFRCLKLIVCLQIAYCMIVALLSSKVMLIEIVLVYV